MTTLDQRLEQAVTRYEADSDLNHQMIHGDENTEVTTENGAVPSRAKSAKDSREWFEGQVQEELGSIESHAQQVEQNKNASTASAAAANADANRAAKIAGLDDVQSALRLAAVPTPDFELPLINDLKIREGKGTPYQIDISPAQDGSQMIDLPMYKAGLSRASSKWYVNKAGELVKAEVDAPAFEENGILIEGASTNLCLNSNTYSNKAPDIIIDSSSSWGIMTMHRKTAGNYTSYINVGKHPYPSGWEEGTTYTCWTVVHRGASTVDYIEMHLYSSQGYQRIYYDDSQNVGGSFSKELPNGYFIMGRIITPQSGEDFGAGTVHLHVDIDVSFGSFQIEALPFASSLIPTSGSPATRLKDQPSIKSKITGAFTVFSELTIQNSNGKLTHPICSLDNNKDLYLGFDINGRPEAWLGNVYVAIPAAVDLGNVKKVAFTYDGSTFSVYINGSLHGSVNIGKKQFPAGDLHIGKVNSADLFARIRKFDYWLECLSPEQVAALG